MKRCIQYYHRFAQVTRLDLFAAVLAFAVFGCDSFWLDCYWRSERYLLVAIDSKEQMSLIFDLGNGTGLGLVGPIVFAVGANDKHIVVKQHPSLYDKTLTNYFVVERSASDDFEERQKLVTGPFTKQEFESLSDSLRLPPFEKIFNDLE